MNRFHAAVLPIDTSTYNEHHRGQRERNVRRERDRERETKTTWSDCLHVHICVYCTSQFWCVEICLCCGISVPTWFKYWIPIQSEWPIQWNTLGGWKRLPFHTIKPNKHDVPACMNTQWAHKIRLFNFPIEAFIYLF